MTAGGIAKASQDPSGRAEGSNQHWQAMAQADDDLASFARGWIAVLASELPGLRRALLLLRLDSGTLSELVRWPDRAVDLEDMKDLAQTALIEKRTASRKVEILAEDGRSRLLVAYPIGSESEAPPGALLVVDLQHPAASAGPTIYERLFWSSGLLQAALLRRGLADANRAAMALEDCLDLLAATDSGDRLTHAGLSLVNEVRQWAGATRVSLSVYKGKRMRLVAVSGMANFNRHAPALRQILTLMQEAIGQAAVIRADSQRSSESGNTLHHRRFMEQTGLGSVLSVPVTANDKIIGCLTLEMPLGEQLSDEREAIVTGLCALVGPGLWVRQQADRPLAGAIPRAFGAASARIFGPHHMASKLMALAAAITLIMGAFVEVPFRITADAVVEGRIQRAIVAPFEGTIEASMVRAGDLVSAGQLLAQLDDRDLSLEEGTLVAEREQLSQRVRSLLAQRDLSEMNQIRAQLSAVEARLALVRRRLEQTRITSPMAGRVIKGDLDEQIGAPVGIGDVLFQLAPAQGYRLAVMVDERDVAYLSQGQLGELVVKGLSETRQTIRLGQIAAVSQAEDGANRFRVRAELVGNLGDLRPGMEGVVKISAGHRSLFWVWTRRLRDWVRLTAWRFLP